MEFQEYIKILISRFFSSMGGTYNRFSFKVILEEKYGGSLEVGINLVQNFGHPHQNIGVIQIM